MNSELITRIDRLLALAEESRRMNQLLEQQVHELRAERDNLKLRLQTASQRIDAMLQRLPSQAQAPFESKFEDPAS